MLTPLNVITLNRFISLLLLQKKISYDIKLSLNKRFDIGTVICPQDSRIRPIRLPSDKSQCQYQISYLITYTISEKLNNVCGIILKPLGDTKQKITTITIF